MAKASDDQIRDALSIYGFVPDQSQCAAIRCYISLLLQWNKRISLTTVVSHADVLRFHFGESLYAAVCVPILNGRLADLGSGPGFPGLPLRIALPDLYVILVESNMKKAAFLRAVVQELNLTNAEVVRDRMENIGPGQFQFDFIAARALGNYAATLRWSRRHLSPSGKVVLWLGEKDTESISSEEGWKWSEPALIPGSERRFILAGAMK